MTQRLLARPLGRTGLQVSRLCLGGNRLGAELDERSSYALLDDFVECGGTFIDTALVYADWHPGVGAACSERLLGRWLASRRPEGVIIATKGGHPRLQDGSPPRLDIDSLRADVERSLQNLGLSQLPLWYLHRDDPGRPVDEIVDSVQILADEGLVGAYAACNWTLERLTAAVEYAAGAGRTGFMAHQAAFSLAAPDPDRFSPDLVALSPPLAHLHRRTALPLIAYSPQARGFFAHAGRIPGGLAAAYDTAQNVRVRDRLTAIGERAGLSATQLALRAVLSTDLEIVPIIGPRNGEQLKDSVRACTVELAAADAAALATMAVQRLTLS